MPVTAFSLPLVLVLNAMVAVSLIVSALLLQRRTGRLESRLRSLARQVGGKRQGPGWMVGLERLATRWTPRTYRVALGKRIDRANLTDRVNPATVILLANVLALSLSLFETAISRKAGLAALLLPVNLVLSLVLLGLLLDRRATKRRTAVQRSLASTLDLFVLAMEAGLSFDGALREVVAEWHSPASRELERVVMLGQLGVSRGAALQEIAETLDLDSFRRMASRLSTADRLGTSMVLVLRSEAEEARRERRAIATRKVAQAPTKILVPMALLVLPVTMIVVLGPALPQILRLARGG